MIPIERATQFRKHVDRWGIYFQALLDATGMPSDLKDKTGSVPVIGKGAGAWDTVKRRLANMRKLTDVPIGRTESDIF